jgi:DNA-binding NarL/FixJ family response regulator
MVTGTAGAGPSDPLTSDLLRVMLVDDHDLFRTGLRNLLEEQGVQIVAEASDGASALNLVRELTPDVVVVVLTISDQDGDVMDAIFAGACGYLLKDSSIQDLMQGIRAAAVGESLISPHIASKVLQRIRASGIETELGVGAELSDRETEVLRLIANGKDNSEIAQELHISPKTVKNHISNILMKLQIENRIQAAVYAVRRGLV